VNIEKSRRVAAVRVRRAFLVAVAALTTFVVVMAPVEAQTTTDDPSLDQALDADQPIVAGPAVLSSGHVDIGPRFVDGVWTMMIHDDTADVSVWRSLDETVLSIADAASQPVPEDPNYAFIGVAPGEMVHVISQTQTPGVVWVGWNTQDPQMMKRISRGVTMTLLGVDGPGDMVMYLQSGNFGTPDVLWKSTEAAPQPVWVDVNTHTHANWVFTEPGVYLAQVEISAELIDGTTVRDTRAFRFAVGDGASAEEALSTRSSFSPRTEDASASMKSPAKQAPSMDEGTSATLKIAVAVLAAAMLGAVILVIVRGRTAKRRADAQRQSLSAPDATRSPPANSATQTPPAIVDPLDGD